MPPDSHFQVSDTAPLMPQPSKKVWVNFLPNIDLGHMLTMLGLGAAIFAQWNIMDRRVTTAELKVEVQDKALADVRSDIKEIKAVVLNIQLQQAAASAVRQVQQVK